jgi:hypothetical protein
MTNSIAMTKQSEAKKNTQAAGYTLFTSILLVLAIIFIRWKIPENPVPVPDNLVEISIADEPIQEFIPPPQESGGGGGNPVQAIGDPGVAPPSPPTPGEEDSKDVETNDANKEEVAIKKPVNPNPAAVKVNSNTPLPKPKEVPDPKPPAPQRPKATLGKTTGGTSTGGGAAEDYNRSGGSGNGNGVGTGNGSGGGNGNGAGGGNGNGTGPKNFGTQVFNLPQQSFEDEFNNNAKIAMDVVVSESGKVTSATYQPKGSTGTATAQMKEIARRRAFELKFGPSPGGQKGKVIFNFTVK